MRTAAIALTLLAAAAANDVLQVVTFAVMWWVFSANTPAEQGLFQSGWFVVGLLTQTLVVHMIRTPRLPVVHSRASAVLSQGAAPTTASKTLLGA